MPISFMISPILLARYFLAARSSKKTADDQVRRFYQEYARGYLRELDATLWHYSRVSTSAALESLFVYHAARGFDFPLQREALEIAGLSINAVKIASMRDQWLDDVYVKWLAKSGDINVDSIRTDIANEDWKPTLLSEPIKITVIKKGGESRTFSHQVYFNASKLLQQLYSEGVKRRSESAHRVYRDRKSAVEIYQARDLAVAAHLCRENDEGALKVLGASNYEEAVIACQDLLDKLGIIGGAIPVIVNEMSWRNGRDKETINRELYAIGRETTRFQQLTADDVPSFDKDLRERNPNMLILPAITSTPVYRNQDRNLLVSFLREHPNIVSELLAPISQRMHEAAVELDKLKFAGKEAKFTVKMIVKEGVRKIRGLGKSLGIEFDESWYKEARGLQSNW
jgi:hypothetical protein